MTKKWVLFFSITILLTVTNISAQTLVVPMHLVTQNGQGKSIGIIEFKDSPYGLLIMPDLHDLTPGVHGFHLHEYPSCANMGKAAGGHYDPYKTGKHLGPYNKNGHLGDMPALTVNKNGNAVLTVLAPRLSVKDLYGHAIMIHVGGDNYSDQPKKLGGGGARLACGVVYKKTDSL